MIFLRVIPPALCLFEHDLFRKPVPTFRDHALGARLRHRAGGRAVGLWGLSPKSRGVGRRTTHILVLEPFGVPAVRSGAALSGLTLARRVRIAPERSAFYRPRASALVGGRVSVPDLASVELSALPGQTRPAFSRSASSLFGGPAVVRGGRIRRGRSQTRGAPPNRLSASRARWMRSTGRRRRPRPTSRRLMSAPLGWTGRAQPTTLGIDCQGLFSGMLFNRCPGLDPGLT
jgi:hypothetical protein